MDYRILACRSRLEGITVEIALLNREMRNLPNWRIIRKRTLASKILEKLDKHWKIKQEMYSLRNLHDKNQW